MPAIGPQLAAQELASSVRTRTEHPPVSRPTTTTTAEARAKAQAVALLGTQSPVSQTPQGPDDGFDRGSRTGIGGRGVGGVFERIFKSTQEVAARAHEAVNGGAQSAAAKPAATAPKASETAAPQAPATTLEAIQQPPLPAEHGDLVYRSVTGGSLYAKGADDAHAIHPSDIRQGIATDCWLLASLATVAMNRPELIEKNIRDLGDGTFEVTLYDALDDALFGAAKTFEKVRIVVDGQLPTHAGHEIRAYAEAVQEDDGTPELWSALYEKAVASHYGGYGALTQREGAAGLELVSGAIANQHIASHLDFEQVLGWFEKGDGLTVVSMPSDLAPEFEAYRNGTLVAEHVYYVSDVDAKTGTVEIRNPFGWDHPPVRMPWDEFKHTLGWIDHGQFPG